MFLPLVYIDRKGGNIIGYFPKVVKTLLLIYQIFESELGNDIMDKDTQMAN